MSTENLQKTTWIRLRDNILSNLDDQAKIANRVISGTNDPLVLVLCKVLI